jgi:hypothetical protein
VTINRQPTLDIVASDDYLRMDMAKILYRNDKIVGEITEWENTQSPPEYRDVLGKTVLVNSGNNKCTFTSPKPLNKRDHLVVISEEDNSKLVLNIVKITSGLHVSAIIKEKIARAPGK